MSSKAALKNLFCPESKYLLWEGPLKYQLTMWPERTVEKRLAFRVGLSLTHQGQNMVLQLEAL
jgi:hypothetical protein